MLRHESAPHALPGPLPERPAVIPLWRLPEAAAHDRHRRGGAAALHAGLDLLCWRGHPARPDARMEWAAALAAAQL